jgi:geranylgeranyl reductase family protein
LIKGGDHDVVVVGAGPAGASCAFWLARAGVDVALLERKVFPREKTCGDGLTPRAVRQLEDMGLAPDLAGSHRFVGLRSVGFGQQLELAWPRHPRLPPYGYVVTRHDLDQLVAARAAKEGAALLEGLEAVGPLVEGARCAGAVVKEVSSGRTGELRGRYVVVADGANSRFGRALGAGRDRSYPQGMAIRGYFRSPRHSEPWIESHLEVRDRRGDPVPGYGWVFPLGDGRVNVGVGLLSTFHRWKQVNTTSLMEAFVAQATPSWGLGPGSACGPPTGGRLPMGLSVGPPVGATHLLVGDAAGAVNPFNGEGIAYALETGRTAAEVLGRCLSGQATPDEYRERLEADYGLYFKVARAFVRLIGKPHAMRALAGTGMRSRTLMEWAIRIMANMLRPDELGPAEAVYRALAALAARA